MCCRSPEISVQPRLVSSQPTTSWHHSSCAVSVEHLCACVCWLTHIGALMQPPITTHVYKEQALTGPSGIVRPVRGAIPYAHIRYSGCEASHSPVPTTSLDIRLAKDMYSILMCSPGGPHVLLPLVIEHKC